MNTTEIPAATSTVARNPTHASMCETRSTLTPMLTR